MPILPIYVDKTFFLGRVEEQKQFRNVLREVLAAPADEEQPYIILLYGDGGMGKTTLAKRFRDIAKIEQPFEREFHILWIDWEDERRCNPALQVGRENVRPETVFDVMHARAVKGGWGRYFSLYQDAAKKRGEAEKKAAEAILAGDERDEFAPLRGAGASGLAKLMRVSLPVIGETGEKLAQTFLDAGIKVGAEQAALLRAKLEERLRARLDPRQFELFLNPNEQLARALADGLQKIGGDRPLIVFLDTYEIVDQADMWLRTAIRSAGPKVVWVIGGRDDLARSRPFGKDYFKGYNEEFSSRLLPYNLPQLAEQDVLRMFANRAPDRPLEQAALEAISRATRSVPLALDEAAEMWAKGVPLEEIVGDSDERTPLKEIVHKMTERYLMHVVAETDRRALYALALADGDIEILRAMLRPDGAAAFDLNALLRRLERDYASVHYEHTRLHEEPAFFLRSRLREEIYRSDDCIKSLNQRAVDTLRARLAKIQAEYPSIEERCEDEDWVKAALDLSEHLFWLDEGEAWRWLIPCYVESLAYSKELRQGLLQIASGWKDYLSKSGKKRLKLLGGGPAPDERGSMLDELERLQRLGWLKGENEGEYTAILNWQRGRYHYDQERYPEALTYYERAEAFLPPDGGGLKRLLGEALDDLARELMWPQGATDAIYSEDARRILLKAAAWLPERQGVYYRLGVVLSKSGELSEAIPCFQRAIQLDPKLAGPPHNGLGNVYSDLDRYKEALAAYKQAIQLEQTYAHPHHGLGNVYYRLGRYEEALDAYNQAIQLDQTYAGPHNGLGTVYAMQGRYKEALDAYNQAIQLDPKAAYPYNGLGNVYFNSGRYEDALDAYKQAFQLDPKYAIPHYNLAEVYIRQRVFDKASDELNAGMRLEPSNLFGPLVTLGIVRRYQGLEESEGHFQRALAQWETAWRAKWQTPAGLLEYKAIALLCLGNKDEALQTLRQAITEMLPEDVIDFDYFELLQTAPVPPDGLEEVVAVLKEAERKRKET